MSREIEFRAWDKVKNIMVPVMQMDFPEWWLQVGEIGNEWGERHSFRGDHTDRFVLEQFTGLLDRNGRKIFEGDVLEVFEHGQTRQMWYVGFERGCFVASLDKLQNFTVQFNRISFEQVEVIGTIHDQKEAHDA